MPVLVAPIAPGPGRRCVPSPRASNRRVGTSSVFTCPTGLGGPLCSGCGRSSPLTVLTLFETKQSLGSEAEGRHGSRGGTRPPAQRRQVGTSAQHPFHWRTEPRAGVETPRCKAQRGSRPRPRATICRVKHAEQFRDRPMASGQARRQRRGSAHALDPPQTRWSRPPGANRPRPLNVYTPDCIVDGTEMRNVAPSDFAGRFQDRSATLGSMNRR
jgi:hypothetical protein